MMKVLAVKGDGYIVEVNHTELEKFLNLYYNKLPHLKERDEIDLGRGYDYYRETLEALSKTENFITSNKKVIDGLLNGFSLIGKIAGGAIEADTAAQEGK